MSTSPMSRDQQVQAKTDRNQSQYDAIVNGLAPGRRIVYDNKMGRFIDISRNEIKNYSNSDLYTVNLEDVKEKIVEFISTRGISETQKANLQAACAKRTLELAGRLVIWDKAGKDKAALKLTTFGAEIEKAANQATKIPMATPKRETRAPQPLPPPAQKSLSSQPSVPPPPPTKTEGAPLAPPPPLKQGGPPAPPMTRGGGPPPPPGVRGGAPPPPGAQKPQGPVYSQTHKTVTNPQEKRKLAGEPNPPKIEEGHDLGKLETIPVEKRNQYAAEIEKYVKGTPYETTTRKGTATLTEIRHKEDGVVHALIPMKEALTNHSDDLEALERAQTDLRELQAELTNLDKNLSGLTKAKSEGTDYILYVKDKQELIPVKFVADQTYEDNQEVLKTLSPEDRQVLEENNLVYPKELTVGFKLDELTQKRARLNGTNKGEPGGEIKAAKDKKEEIEKRMEERTNSSMDKIPFNEWGKFVKDKVALTENWLLISANLSKERKAKEAAALAAKPQSEKEIRLEALLTKLPLGGAASDLKTTMGQSTTLAGLYKQGFATLSSNVVNESGK